MPVERYPHSSGDNTPPICVHPTESWILRTCFWDSLEVWDYDRLEKMNFCFAQPQQFHGIIPWEEGDLYGDADGQLCLPPGLPKFVSQKRWILIGSNTSLSRRNPGYIYVYSYMAVQNFKGSKTYLLSKIKSFKAHDRGSVLLDVHPSRPYVLSSAVHVDTSRRNTSPMGTVKLWDWESGWNCVRTINMEAIALQPQFDSKDQDIFVTISPDDGVKVWNIDSPKCKSKLPKTSDAKYFDFFTQGGKQYLIIIHGRENKSTIWDYHSGTLVETLKENISTACSHPELPVLITGSDDGRVLIWTSSTFRLVGVLNCGLGDVHCVVGVKGSGRIVIEHAYGIAVAEIDHMLEIERLHESEGSDDILRTDEDKAGYS